MINVVHFLQKSRGDLIGSSEKSKTDRKRERRMKRAAGKKAGVEKARATKLIEKLKVRPCVCWFFHRLSYHLIAFVCLFAAWLSVHKQGYSTQAPAGISQEGRGTQCQAVGEHNLRQRPHVLHRHVRPDGGEGLAVCSLMH